MRILKLLFIIVILFFGIFYSISCTSKSNDQKSKIAISGRWEGLLQFPNKSFRILADISLDTDKNLIVKLSSPQQKAFLIVADSLEYSNNNIGFKLSKYKAVYSGVFKMDSSEIAGVWKQGKSEVPLIFYREGELGRTNRPQYPFRPYPYNSDSVTFKNQKAGVTLAGTFTYPKGSGPFPAVLLINGVGPQDRDESMYAHKPFLIIADYLTRQGFAVLRVDDRGTGLSTGNFNTSTTKDFASDALASVNFLKSKIIIDSTKLGLIGFNEGGLIAAMLAAKSNDIKFIVILSTPGIPGKDIMLDQTLNMQKKIGVPDKEIEQDYGFNEKIFKIIQNTKDTVEVRNKLKAAYKNFIASLGKGYAMNEKYSTGNISKQINFMIQPWFRYYLTFNPGITFKHVHCPSLILYGSNDLQVNPEKNNAAIEGALKEGGNHNFKSIIFPGMNHLFQETDNGSPAEYAMIKETISPKVLKNIVNWMNKTLRKQNRKEVAVR